MHAPAGREIALSLYTDVRAVTPSVVRVTWEQLPVFLRFYRSRTKEGAPLWSPAELAPERTRAARAVRLVHLAVLDLDLVPDLDWRRCLAPRLVGLRHVLHSTWRDFRTRDEGRRRLRLILDLDRAVRPAEWPELHSRLGWWSGCRTDRPREGVDQSGRDAAHMYYFPSAPEGDALAFCHHEPTGRALAVDELLAIPEADLRRTRPTVATLSRLSARLIGRKRRHAQDLGRRLGQLAAGERYAVPGERDEVTFRLVAHLLGELAGATVEEVTATFEASLAVMASDPDPLSIQVVHEKAERLAAGRSEESESELRGRWRAAMRRAFRDQPYEETTATRLAADVGVDRDVLDWAWVLQFDKWYWILHEDDRGRAAYRGPVSARALPEAAEVTLAPADPLGVVCQVTRAGKVGRKGAADLVAEHGAVLDRLRRTLVHQQSTYDPRRRELTLAVAPVRDVEPRECPEIAEWLRLLGGPQHDRLLDWIASCVRLEEPVAALYLHTITRSGKNLLAQGLARLWTVEGPTKIQDALHRFNDRLATCPLVYADERVPKDREGALIDEIRDLVGSHSHRFEGKFNPVSDLEGAIRLLIGANNPYLLLRHGPTTAADVQAVCARVLYVRALDGAAAAYLAGLGGRPALAPWVADDLIARHALHLAATRRVERGDGFLVEGDEDSELVRQMVTGSGLRGAICHWLVSWLLRPEAANAQGSGDLFRVAGSLVYCSARGLHQCWGAYDVSWRGGTPPAGRLRAALDGIAETQTWREVGDGRVQFHRVRLALLSEWAARHGYASEEDLGRRAHAIEHSLRSA